MARGALKREDLSEVDRQVLDAVVEYYVTSVTPTPLDHVILSAPVELAGKHKAAVVAKGELIDLGGLPPRY